MSRGVAAGGPARALAQQQRMVHVSDINLSNRPMLHLSMAFEAEVRIGFDQQLAIHRAVRVMAHGAAFSHRFVLENKWPGLLAVTLGAVLVKPRHGQAAGWFENVAAVRIVALDAIHASFDNRMMLGQVKLGVGLQMTLKTSGRIFAGIDNELAASAPGRDVFAARPVTGLASGLAGHFGVWKIEASVGANGEPTSNVGMAIVTGLIAGISCAGNFRRSDHGAGYGRTGTEECQPSAGKGNGNGNCADRASADWIGDPALHGLDSRKSRRHFKLSRIGPSGPIRLPAHFGPTTAQRYSSVVTVRVISPACAALEISSSEKSWRAV